jgi:hypothetical protein
MSTAPFPGAYPFAVGDAAAQHLATVGEAPVRRRANANQARAIEKLGHVVDHLIYSRMFLTDAAAVKADAEAILTDAAAVKADAEAIHILMVLRRSVFEECERVVSEDRQAKRWIRARLKRRAN